MEKYMLPIMEIIPIAVEKQQVVKKVVEYTNHEIQCKIACNLMAYSQPKIKINNNIELENGSVFRVDDLPKTYHFDFKYESADESTIDVRFTYLSLYSRIIISVNRYQLPEADIREIISPGLKRSIIDRTERLLEKLGVQCYS